ncbi:ATP-binding cassette domain-containing protein [Halovulum dunhuangense]|uniref:ATP-binding cassette domain-containing protein n=1 Tax=Halovulum dunhuangense TaxID=1505036 RepID=A0A849L3X9_9RHOB|nr:ATP-binding cassette domain-containing protein [Halovulum dunhuangense]NNU80867.1 ATP-binding cassette domain-containing protein [Halovulum dunhuangense]
MAEAGLRLDHVRINLRGRALISLDTLIRPGEVTTVMGPSGSGKSSLLALVTGTLAPEFETAGQVRIDGHDLSGLRPEARRIGILFQDHLLFPHLSVGENLAFGLHPRIEGRAARAARIGAALSEVGLAGFADRDPATLSGGQRARVALMRMLLSEPRAVLLDEPFSGLDAALRAQIRAQVLDHVRQQRLPCLMVTHDLEDAQAAGGPILRVG